MSKKIPNKNLKSRETSVAGSLLCVDKTIQVFDIKKKLWLYRFVYSSRFSLSVVLLLLVSFSLQSVERAYANEEVLVENSIVNEEVIQTPEVAETVPEESVAEEVAPQSIDEGSPVVEDVLLNDTTEPEFPESDVVIDDSLTSSDDSVQEPNLALEDNLNINEIQESTTTSTTTATDTVVEFINEDPVTETLDESISEILEIEEGSEPELNESSDFSSENEITNSSSTEELGTSTEMVEEIVLETTYEAVSVTQSDSEFSFSKDECTQLATGSFYCLQPQQNQLDDALFSAPDENGDLEIYLIRDGVQVQITNNLVDDAAPYYDLNSETLVWHRFVNDSYQIISFDPEKQEEIQLTNDSVNNMEPTRQGDYTAWQRWVDGGWNIVLFDGENERQITKNNNHNVAPYIHGSLVVWNSKNQSGEKTIEMFDIKTSTYVTVDDPDGLSVSNPRMVFVYDSLHPNGDIVTRGYDVMARKFIDLDTLPRDLPEEIPPADSTGETRALIQAKPSIKSEVEESLGSTTPNILPPVSLDTASSTDLMTLDLSKSTTTAGVEEIVQNASSTEFDIVIEPFILSDATSTESVQE